MPTGPTIAAVATGPAQAPLAIIRVSGPDVPRIASDHLGITRFERACSPATISLAGNVLPVRALLFPAPNSFTGEHVLEIVLPGNPALCERVIDAIGAARAGPGEFSARAHLSGRLSLGQAEGVAALIAAETDADLEAARDLLSGARGERYTAWSDRLTNTLALVEAGIDFTDQEDVVAITPDQLRSNLDSLRDEITAELGALAGAESLTHRPRVALVGDPSAGKSTLFNALLARARSVIHDAPGTTRDAIVEPLDLSHVAPGAGTVDLIDLPGLDPPRTPAHADPIGAQAQRLANEIAHNADLRLHCDPTGRFERHWPGPTLRVRTKADLAERTGPCDVSVCALDGQHMTALRRAIADHAFSGVTRGSPPRHRAALARTLTALDRAAEAPTDELIAGDLRAALDAIGELTGEVTPDDVIGRVFAAFCVGK